MRIQLFIDDKYWYSLSVSEIKPDIQIAWFRLFNFEWWKNVDENEDFHPAPIKRFIFKYDRMVNENTAKYILVDVK